MRRICLLFFLFTLLLNAQDVESNSLKQRFLIGGDLGLTYTSSDYQNNGVGYIVRGVGEYYIFEKNNHLFGLRIYGGYGTSAASNDSQELESKFSTKMYFVALGGFYSYPISEALTPYLFIGAKYLNFSPEDENGNDLPNNASDKYDKNSFDFNFELGIKYKFSKNFYGYASLTPISISQDYIDDIKSGDANDYVFALSIGALYAIRAPWAEPESEFVGNKKLPEGVEYQDLVEEQDTSFSDETMDEKIVEPNQPVEEKIDEEKKESANIISEVPNKLEKGVVHFGFGETELNRMEYVELDRLFTIIDQDKNKWKIIGYTDNIEPEQVHQSLAIQRAYFVLRYFMSKGIDRNRFEVVVKGEEDPVADNSTPEGRSKNRRVEIVKIK